MNRDRWHQVQRILSGAIELPEERQEDYVKEHCGDDAPLCAQVEELLAAHRQASTFIERPAIHGFPKDWPDGLIGARFGAYKLVERIGEGGMGAVYRAERSDGQFTQQVAVKLVRPGLGSQDLLRRLRGERQILASLNHKNIARLLDGGVSADGQPFVVMEYIHGTRVTEYCEKLALNNQQRLRLFQEICSAVSYAHQHLIVHRDIKPGNILVAEDGAPKLLDFGIAKILGPLAANDDDKALTQLNPLTPDYASPEQLRGEAITTATDVYSLGVLLYELLTSQRPYKLKDKTPLEAMKVVCDTDPARPSAVVSSQRDGKKQSARPGISSDLDAIVLKAMRKEPEQRYASVDKFSEDIGNFLAARPVSAHQGSWRYVAGKFVRRHRTGVLMSAALALLLAVGISAVLWEVHVARVERVRAERHFNEVRKLANSVTFELHDSIKDLPGATPARKLIVDRALEYLDALSRETGNDLSLQHELAAAYEKVGDVQGYPFGANIGNTVGAINSYRKALAIRQSLLAKDPKNRVFQQELSGIYWKIGISLDGQADFTGALADLRKALALTEESGAAKDSARGSDQLAGDYRAIASVQAETGDLTGALGSYRQAASIREAAIAAYPADSVALRTHLAADYYGMSEVLDDQGQKAPALDAARHAVAILQALSQNDPGNATLRQYLADTEAQLANCQETQGLLDESIATYRQALQIYQAAMLVDPNDARNRRLTGFTLVKLGRVLTAKGQATAALATLNQALAVFRELARTAPTSDYLSHSFGNVYGQIGDTHAALAADSRVSRPQQRAHWTEACSWYQKSMQIRLDLQRRGELLHDDIGAMAEVAKKMAKCDATAEPPKASSLIRFQSLPK